MSTEQALQFLIDYLKKEGRMDLLNKKQWEVLKKYKNPQGNTTRDFFNEIYNVKMMVITDKVSEVLTVMPNINYLHYLNSQDVRPSFFYAPFISNYGLTFHFSNYSDLSNHEITVNNAKNVQSLLEKLKMIFIGSGDSNTDKDVIFIEKENMLMITHYDTNMIIDKLEQNNYKFNSEIFKHYQNKFFQPVYPDLLDIKYHFPQDQGKSSQQCINTILTLLAKGELNDESYTRIRKLIRKVTLEDLKTSKKVAVDINVKEGHKTQNLFELEIKRRKIKDIIG